MPRTHYSNLYNISREVFSEIVKTSTSYSEIVKKCKEYKGVGGHINTIKKRIKLEKINSEHIKDGYDHNKGRSFLSQQVSLDDALKNYFVVNSEYYNKNFLKTLIRRFELKKYECEICKLKNVWENKPLSLQLDHINGTNSDNRLENLRWLCPNCHSQTETFSGKTSKKIHKCSVCDDEISKQSKTGLCIKCLKIKKEKVCL